MDTKYNDCVVVKGCYEICEPYEHIRDFFSIIPTSQWEAFVAHCKKEREDPHGFGLKDGYSAKVLLSSSPDFEAVIRWEGLKEIDTDFFERITKRTGDDISDISDNEL
jgi:hypothetical protein